MAKFLFTLLMTIFVSMSAHVSSLSAQDQPPAADASSGQAADEAVTNAGDAAENAPDENDLGKDEDFAFGTVVSIGDNSLTILEYNFDNEQEVQMIYDVNADTKFENVSSIKEIAVNDEVEVNFKEQDGKKVATFISKDLPIEDDSYLEDKTGDEAGMGAEDNAVPPMPENAVVPDAVK